MNQTDKIIKSKRNTDIHATLVLSNDKTSKKGLIMVHGFKADRTEGGRFIELAHNLALKGINCICMSFPGCGDSTEDFFNYTLDNCLDDIDTCVNYMVENIGIDLKETGMVGYSMGGRLSCLYVKKHPEIKSVALWAAASYNSKPEESFQGSRFDEMIDEAKANGVCLRKNNFDNSTLNFSLDFLNNMLELKPHIYKSFDSSFKKVDYSLSMDEAIVIIDNFMKVHYTLEIVEPNDKFLGKNFCCTTYIIRWHFSLLLHHCMIPS